MEWAPRTPEELVVKNKFSPRSGSAALKQLNLIHKKGPQSFFKKVFLIYCAYSDFGE